MREDIPFQVRSRCNLDENNLAVDETEHRPLRDIKNRMALFGGVLAAEGDMFDLPDEFPRVAFLKDDQPSIADF